MKIYKDLLELFIYSRYSSETKLIIKPTVIGEIFNYDFCLSEKTVTLEFIQFQTLMISENVQRNLYKEWAIIVEDENYFF